MTSPGGLQAGARERAGNVVIGDLVRSDVAPVAEVGSVEVPATVVGSPRGRLPAALVGARELAGSS